MSVKDKTNPRENRGYERQSVLSFLHIAERPLWVDAGILVIANINVHQRTAMRQAGDGRFETERPTSTGLRTAESGQIQTSHI